MLSSILSDHKPSNTSSNTSFVTTVKPMTGSTHLNRQQDHEPTLEFDISNNWRIKYYSHLNLNINSIPSDENNQIIPEISNSYPYNHNYNYSNFDKTNKQDANNEDNYHFDDHTENEDENDEDEEEEVEEVEELEEEEEEDENSVSKPNSTSFIFKNIPPTSRDNFKIRQSSFDNMNLAYSSSSPSPSAHMIRHSKPITIKSNQKVSIVHRHASSLDNNEFSFGDSSKILTFSQLEQELDDNIDEPFDIDD